SPATYARTSPNSPGAHISRRTAWGDRTTSTGASGGPASEPSQARSRHGDSGAPRTVRTPPARRVATVGRSVIAVRPPLGQAGAPGRGSARTRPEERLHPPT